MKRERTDKEFALRKLEAENKAKELDILKEKNASESEERRAIINLLNTFAAKQNM